MATIAEGGLFPAIIDAYVPAISVSDLTSNLLAANFDIGYNSRSDVKSVHISLTRQSNYHSAFDKTNYYRGVYVVNTPDQGSTDTAMSVTIPYDKLEVSELSFNEYYKLQVRLSSITIPGNATTQTALSNYLTNEDNLTHFSEWSTVCLIRFIESPTLELKINGEDVVPNTSVNIDTSKITLAGTYVNQQRAIDNPPFAGQTDEEFLNRYKVRVLDGEDVTVFESEYLNIDIHNVNQFNYTIPYYFDIDNYQIQIDLETCNLYTTTIAFNANVSYDNDTWGSQSIVQEIVGVNNVLGKVNITFIPFDDNTTIPSGSQFVIRRGCDKDGFSIWDNIYSKTLTAAMSGTDALSFDDFTVESGNLYKYEITYVSPTAISGHTHFTIVEGPAMTIFDHAFLNGEGTQLCVKFNPNVGSYQVNLVDNVVTTIGGKYPYISRNGDMYYRSFSLSGTIAYEMDEQHQFSSRSSIYGDWIQVYGSYFVNHYLNQRNDRVTQRKFRELVMEYLYNDTPKLFRSTPEGNILVRLTNVSLTPNNQLGRMIYDFSCTATEIGEPSIENCKMYKIQDFGD